MANYLSIKKLEQSHSLKALPLLSGLNYLVLMPILLYGTSLGVIKQTNMLLSVELLSISLLLLMFDITRQPSRGKYVSFGLIMLGFGMFSRLISIWIPGVNAIAAFVMLTGVYGGSHLGFTIGGLAPLLTNMIFLQGAWTPFQMYAYGMLGVIAGLALISKLCLRHRWFLTGFAIVMGVAYSLFMDTWTLLSINTSAGWHLYLILIAQAIPFTIKYALSNGVFINLLKRPVAKLVKVIDEK